MVSIGTDFFVPLVAKQPELNVNDEAESWLAAGNFRFGGVFRGRRLEQRWYEWSDRARCWRPLSDEAALARVQIWLLERYGKAMKADVEEMLFAARCEFLNYEYPEVDSRENQSAVA